MNIAKTQTFLQYNHCFSTVSLIDFLKLNEISSNSIKRWILCDFYSTLHVQNLFSAFMSNNGLVVVLEILENTSLRSINIIRVYHAPHNVVQQYTIISRETRVN